MDREELYNLIEEEVDNIFLKYQIANKIESGDITPMQLLRLKKLQNELTDLIIEIRSYH